MNSGSVAGRSAGVGVGESKCLGGIGDAGRPVEIEHEAAEQSAASQIVAAFSHQRRQRERAVPRGGKEAEATAVDLQRRGVLPHVPQERVEVRRGFAVRVSDRDQS